MHTNTHTQHTQTWLYLSSTGVDLTSFDKKKNQGSKSTIRDAFTQLTCKHLYLLTQFSQL